MMYTPQEQRTHREALCAALRSGQYEQAQGLLRTDKGFCCLGVGCDISGLGKWTMLEVHHTWIYVVDPNYPINGPSSVLPSAVKEYYGFASAGGGYGEDAMNALWKLNDRSRWDFSQIADVIESEPEGLLTPEAARWREVA